MHEPPESYEDQAKCHVRSVKFSSFTLRLMLSITSWTDDRSKSPRSFIRHSTNPKFGPGTFANDKVGLSVLKNLNASATSCLVRSVAAGMRSCCVLASAVRYVTRKAS